MNNFHTRPVAQQHSPPLLSWRRIVGRHILGRRAGRGSRHARRGVLLLLMLSLMVLFAVLGVTYVLMSSQFRRTTAVQPRAEQYTPDYRNQLDEAAMQVFRGSNSPMSVLGPHGLLEDIYGNDSVSSTSFQTPLTVFSAVSSFQSTNSNQPGQLIDLTLEMTNTGAGPNPAPTPLPWPLAPFYTNDSTGTPQSTPNLPTQPYPGPPPYFQGATSSLPASLKPWGAAMKMSAPGTKISTPTTSLVANSAAPNGFFNGCVMTFTNGPAAGQSTRIVGYDNGLGPNNTNGIPTLRVMDFPGSNSLIATSVANKSAAAPTSLNTRFVINGRPFNGTGFGFSTSTGFVDARDGNSRLAALLPNPVTFAPTGSLLTPQYNVAGGIGGADEDYDAADWNNMLLGLPRDPRDVLATPITALPVPAPFYPPYPSLHRPELIQYWLSHATPPPTNGIQDKAFLPLLRQAMLRPVGPMYDASHQGFAGAQPDHPNFTGSNPNLHGTFDPINGPWDVDNDGDGIPDSVWVDIGLAAKTAADGTTYKPLIAIRVLDLDGRLNVNAHGDPAHTEAAFTAATAVSANFATPTGGAAVTSLTPVTATTAASGNVGLPTPGSGAGPSEVSLAPLFQQQASTMASSSSMPSISPPYPFTVQSQYQSVLAGTTYNGTPPAPATSISLQLAATQMFEGRYGESATTAPTTAYDSTVQPSGSTPPYPGLTTPSVSGSQLLASAMGLVKHWELPIPTTTTYANGYQVATSYPSSPDLSGRDFTVLDITGTPFSPSMSATPIPTYGGLGGQFDGLGNPYLLNLSRSAMRSAKATGVIDNPFTPGELERLLRAYDSDAGALSPRLASLLDPSSLVPLPTKGINTGTSVGNPPAGLGYYLPTLRNQVTTESFDLPSPSILTPTTKGVYAPNQRGLLPLAGSVADLLTARLGAIANTGLSFADPNLGGGGHHSGWNNLNLQLQLMLPPEVLAGQRFDINRPFGNGRDDDGDGVVDEPDEYSLGEPAWFDPADSSNTPISAVSAGRIPATTVNLAIDWNGDNTIDSRDALMARHLMARYLYVMAMMLVDPSLLDPTNPAAAIQYDQNYTVMVNLVNKANPYQVQYALAQWAINAVDFRDRDSTMTPFEFDINPFNGWGVDGVIGDGFAVSNDDTTNWWSSGERGLVWGCERPELLITETLAWHDRRTQDLTVDGGTVQLGTDAHNDFDQQLLPMPACFIELYNPWTTQYANSNSTAPGEQFGAPSPAEVPGDLYYDANNINASVHPYPGVATYPQKLNPPLGVVLNKMDPTGKSPVWRLIFVNNGLYSGTVTLVPPSASGLDPRYLDPDDPVLNLNIPNFNTYVDRVAYFVAPVGTYPQNFPNGVNYYPSVATQGTLKPGRYAVVGSYSSGTYAGDQLGGVSFSKMGRSSANTSTSSPNADTNPRKIVLTRPASATAESAQVQIFNSGQHSAEPHPILGGSTGTDAQYPIAIGLDTASFQGVTGPRTFGITDPINGYRNAASASRNPAGEPQLASPFPRPYDQQDGDPLMMTNQTNTGYRAVHLQRLANPELPYNGSSNPYLTIDSAMVDVTAFNGVSATQDPPVGGGAGAQAISTTPFCSTQRGDQYLMAVPTIPQSLVNQPNQLWVHEFGHVPLTPGGAGLGVLAQPPRTIGLQVFPPILHHSLGYLNQQYGIASGTNNLPYTAASNTAYTSATGGGAKAAPLQTYAGAPTTPFPWLTWNNRPYTTPLELTLVPKSRSSRLLYDYSGVNPGTPTSLYTTPAGKVAMFGLNPTAPNSFYAFPNPITPTFFNHLLNFFDGGSTNYPANLYRLFDLVQVPSKFVGTDTVLNATTTTGSPTNTSGITNSKGTTLPVSTPLPAPTVQTTLLNGDIAPGISGASTPTWNNSATVTYGAASSPFGSYVRPPLNKVSEYREPGRMNINTVQDPAVWQGVLGGNYYPRLNNTPIVGAASAAPLPNIAATIAVDPQQSIFNAPWPGSGVGRISVPTTMPSYFTNPFRSAGGAVLTNSIYAQNTGAAPYQFSIGPALPASSGFTLRDIDATLLRPYPIGSSSNNALFDSQAISGGGTAAAYNDPNRNYYFRIQNASRMSNLLTTRSNVYAVWITVGYFQVTPWYGYGSPPKTSGPITYDVAHQDGYQLGQELGADSGQIKRHRAFYIFDRTIPVGFERGVDHNVQNAILLRRFIE